MVSVYTYTDPVGSLLGAVVNLKKCFDVRYHCAWSLSLPMWHSFVFATIRESTLCLDLCTLSHPVPPSDRDEELIFQPPTCVE